MGAINSVRLGSIEQEIPSIEAIRWVHRYARHELEHTLVVVVAVPAPSQRCHKVVGDGASIRAPHDHVVCEPLVCQCLGVFEAEVGEQLGGDVAVGEGVRCQRHGLPEFFLEVRSGDGRFDELGIQAVTRGGGRLDVAGLDRAAVGNGRDVFDVACGVVCGESVPGAHGEGHLVFKDAGVEHIPGNSAFGLRRCLVGGKCCRDQVVVVDLI